MPLFATLLGLLFRAETGKRSFSSEARNAEYEEGKNFYLFSKKNYLLSKTNREKTTSSKSFSPFVRCLKIKLGKLMCRLQREHIPSEIYREA